MTVPTASVVIPTAGGGDRLRRSLDHLVARTPAQDTLEVVIAVNGPDAAMDRIVAENSAVLDIRVIQSLPPGPGPTRNAGARIARGDILIFLGEDVLAAPELIDAHLAHHREHRDVVVAGPISLEPISPEPAHCRIARESSDRRIARLAQPAQRPTLLDVSADNMSVSRQHFIDVGGFSTAFAGCGREDLEIAFRLRNRGLGLVHEPAAAASRRCRVSIAAFLRRFRDLGRADVRFLRLHPLAFREIAGFGLQPCQDRFGTAAAIAEWLAIALDARGGGLWRRSAWRAQLGHYWEGVRLEARDDRELRFFLDEWAANRPHSFVNPFPMPAALADMD